MTIPLGTAPTDCIWPKEFQNYTHNGCQWMGDREGTITISHLFKISSLIVHRLQGTLDDLACLWTHDLKDIKVLSEVCHFGLCDAPCLLHRIQCER